MPTLQIDFNCITICRGTIPDYHGSFDSKHLIMEDFRRSATYVQSVLTPAAVKKMYTAE